MSVSVSFGSAPTDSSAVIHVPWPTVVNREETVTMTYTAKHTHTVRKRSVYCTSQKQACAQSTLQCSYKGKHKHMTSSNQQLITLPHTHTYTQTDTHTHTRTPHTSPPTHICMHAEACTQVLMTHFSCQESNPMLLLLS